MVDEDAIQARRMSAAQIMVAGSNPFFSSLMMMAPTLFTSDVPTAATDGVRMFYNSQFMKKLSLREFAGVVVHEVLHAALLHLPRRGNRHPYLWNIAADIQVNSLIRSQMSLQNELDLPEGVVEDETLAHLSVEEIYAVLQRNGCKKKLVLLDLQSELASDDIKASDLEAHWGAAMHRAMAAAASAGRGTIAENLRRAFHETYDSQLDWRSSLWRFMVRTPDDFGGFDRRHVWQGLYIETLETETVRVDVCVDTSGSIDQDLLSRFIGEVRGITRSYPSIRCRLFYSDAQCNGPFEIDADRSIPTPIGGGGTSFCPFFEQLDLLQHQSIAEVDHDSLAVYFTDGDGEFPKKAPSRNVLWVVCPGGADSAKFPFGQVVRMQQ